jgi:hypothetical protein
MNKATLLLLLILLLTTTTVTGCSLDLKYDNLGNLESVEFVAEECPT